VRLLTVTLDGRRLSPAEGFLVRKGPGNCWFDFAQRITFTNGDEDCQPQISSIQQQQQQQYLFAATPYRSLYHTNEKTLANRNTPKCQRMKVYKRRDS